MITTMINWIENHTENCETCTKEDDNRQWVPERDCKKAIAELAQLDSYHDEAYDRWRDDEIEWATC